MYDRIRALLFAGMLFSGIACTTQEDTPEAAFPGFVEPSHFPKAVYNFEGNPLTRDGFELGRTLFYEKGLSRGGQVSCGSCHAQVHAFADHSARFSTGVDGRIGRRNAPGLSNLAWHSSFLADGGVNHLEVMPLAPISDHREMDMELNELIDFLRADERYPKLFAKAFGTELIDSQRLLFALAQFQGMIVSSNSRYDDYLLGKSALNAQELRGEALFTAHCASCHSGALQSDFSFRNNGLDTVFSDRGRAEITLDESDVGKFKVPSLRNAEWTYPYMHDGRFWTLEDVLEHYAAGIQSSPSLDPSLPVGGIALSLVDQADLIVFIKTLSDETLLRDRRFSEPLDL